MMLDLEGNKETFITLVKNYIKRPGINNFMNYLLGSQSDFFIAPSSTRYHLSIPGGLCQHSINVFNRLVKEVESEYGSTDKSPYSMETIAIVSLFHDVCKVNFYKPYKKSVKDDITGEWNKVDAYKIDEELPICHGYKSQYIVRSYIDLSREESIAIMSHMGGFDPTVKGGDNTISNSFEKFPLALLLHVANLKASKLDE